MVPTLILEVITLCAVVEMKSPVNGSDIKFRSGDGHICFFKMVPTFISEAITISMLATLAKQSCPINGSDVKIRSVSKYMFLKWFQL